MSRPFAGSQGKTPNIDTADAQNKEYLATSAERDNGQSRRSTISIFSTPHTSTSRPEGSTPLLSPTPSKSTMPILECQPLTTDMDESAPTDKARSMSFMSHSQHHEVLKAASRPRSDSAASNSSGSVLGLQATRGGVAGAFGAVTNLVSNVRHAYTPSVSSQTSNAGRTMGPPIQRFLECEADDLKMSEVALLLADYKRLAACLYDST